MYQAGELDHYEQTLEHGDSQRETEETGFMPPPPPPPFVPFEPSESSHTSVPRPGPPLGYWDFYPYYYDYRFLTGQFPPGTFTYASNNFEQGMDHWHDAHYVKENIPSAPVQQKGSAPSYPAAPQHPSEPQLPGKQPLVRGGQLYDSQGVNKANLAPGFDSNYGVSSSQYSPGAVPHANQPVLEPGHSQAAVHRESAAPVGSSSPSRPAQSDYSSSAVGMNPVAPAGAGFQPQEIDWVVPPRSFSDQRPAAAPHGVFSSPAHVSPPRPPPGPMYQAGELDHYEQTLEHGDSQRETEETGFMPPPPPPPFVPFEPSESSHTSVPRPGPPLGYWDFYPYYYDYRFLTGQFPPGTFTYASNNFEQGMDHWHDAHYVKENIPSAPVQQKGSAPSYPAAPQHPSEPQLPGKQPVVAGY
ncbi:basic salivary proline-rich protein 2-like [Echeneis naucrates]|uniref:basic salivary proline-rich protein 2-like n=1 Tax=Echeneis naucrates TaxID=173247 RepID=UPI0011132FEE|nr:basic salivary proline-rich protein 2-like [Echeneis naucrates]